ncbi:MAG: DNA recombination protein RmuC [Bacteroidaceae bacterium]|nr:DNA recombination protein RmuC [Bacteroidaceae bacterium]
MGTFGIIISVIVGALVGALVTALVLQQRHGKVATQVDVLQAQLKSEAEQATKLMQAAETAHREAMESKETAHQNTLEAKEKAYREALEAKEKTCQDAIREKERSHQEALAAQQKQFDMTIAKVEAQMKVATDEMLKQRQKEFAESSNTNLGQIVNPLRETIDKMKQAMAENTEKQTAMSGEMKANIENMMRQSEAAKRSADELNRTFRMGNRVQGDWGETILDELLESQGLKRGIHYDTQPYIRDAAGNVVRSSNGTVMRPDVILHLDQRREVVIDSKVSLTAFMDYANAATDEERKRFLKAHIESLKAHVRELSTKDYSSYIQPPKAKMDYVIMFVPHSAALWTALNAQPDLWRNAMTQNVFIADEQTLFAALRIINLTWTQIAQAQNHEKVYALANEMLDRVGQFMKKYQDLRHALDRANQAYKEGARKLAPTGQSILTTCAKLQKLGAKQSDKNPLPQLTDIDDIPALEAQETPETPENGGFEPEKKQNDPSE